jgi:Protein of unknown function (DUF2439)
MSATTPRSLTALSALPPTQNTAPVLEYRCLYTSDLRRKQKRWQDGRLKFHTFNKRIMVFDDRGNVVGDTHWRQDHNFDEGEELELERSGKLVQVTEYEGRRDQDLTELFDKRLKEREERVAAKTSRSFQELTRSSNALSNQMPDTVDRKPRQPVSPADQLQHRPAKRRKPNSDFPLCKSGYAQSLMGATLTLSGKLTSSSLQAGQVWARTSRSHEHVETTNQRDEHTIRMTTPQERASVESRPPLPVRGNHAQCMNDMPLMLGWRPPTPILVVDRSATGAIGRTDILCEAPENKLKDDKIYKRGLGRVKDSTKCPRPDGEPTSSRSSNSSISLDAVSKNEAKPRFRPSLVDPQETKVKERFRFLERSKPLRIKSRPKKKLLCMDNPQPHSLTRAASKTERCEKSAIQLQNSRPPLLQASQGTERLDSFHKAQERRLHDRLNRKRSLLVDEPQERLMALSENPQQPPISSKLAYLSEGSLFHRRDSAWSLAMDTGTNYRTVDTIPPRKSPGKSPREKPRTIEAKVQVPVELVTESIIEGPKASKLLRCPSLIHYSSEQITTERSPSQTQDSGKTLDIISTREPVSHAQNDS